MLRSKFSSEVTIFSSWKLRWYGEKKVFNYINPRASFRRRRPQRGRLMFTDSFLPDAMTRFGNIEIWIDVVRVGIIGLFWEFKSSEFEHLLKNILLFAWIDWLMGFRLSSQSNFFLWKKVVGTITKFLNWKIWQQQNLNCGGVRLSLSLLNCHLQIFFS